MLGDEEREIYKWLRELYSLRWIAETLMLDVRETKEKAIRIYRKLGVNNQKSLCRAYRALDGPEKAVVDHDAIEAYLDRGRGAYAQGDGKT
jgi:DNA-binding CsgD family transcriptional regulator